MNRHVSTSLFFSGLPPKEKEEIFARFQDMEKKHSKHLNMLDSIKREVAEGTAMFTENDYIEYFDEIEDIPKDSITIYTDLLNELNDAATKSKLDPVAAGSMDFFVL